jgi:hypothetical protein
MNPFFAFVMTMGEAFLTLIFARFSYRMVKKGIARIRHPGGGFPGHPGEGRGPITKSAPGAAD